MNNFHGNNIKLERPPALAADFIISAANFSQFPEPRFAELALLGRSNAGTWEREGAPFLLADLPGYGFAAAPKAMVAGWRKLAEDYLTARRPLKMALLLMDIRRDPAEDEFGLLAWLNELSIPAWVIATKADKPGQSEKAKRLRRIREIFGAHSPLERPPLPFSALTGEGRDALIDALVHSGLLRMEAGEL